MSDMKKSETLLERYNISLCLYPPQESRSILPDGGDTPVAMPVAPSWVSTFSQTLPEEILMEFGRRLSLAVPGGVPLSRTAWAAELACLLSELAERVVELRPFLTALHKEAAHDPLLRMVWEELENKMTTPAAPQSASLAPRERQVLELAASGESNVAIAQQLGLQTVTVTKALSRAYAKLGARNRGEAIFKWLVSRSG